MDTESFVSIGSHSLFLSLSSQDAHASSLVVFLAGAGDVAASFGPLARLVGVFAPVMRYDRSGLGRSEQGPHRPTATRAATELHQLRVVAHLEVPFILVAHSYGAIVAREYLHQYPNEVAGMVLVDASTERQGNFVQAIHQDAIAAVLGNMNFAQVTGLRAQAQLSRDEWRTRAADISRSLSTWQAESALLHEVCDTLGQKDQYRTRALGAKPLVVLRARPSQDYERIYAAGVAAGQGTEAQRAAFRDLLDRWDAWNQETQAAQLQLSSMHRLVDVPDCGHHVHLIRPELVAAEVRWVYNQILDSQGLSNL
ncbi:hypothetical protein EYZ11_004964 [Aspergillus tanneri]|uniref:AB hydrolase-1 domain-containing protein n=1 Tax=Aspergillus tanneri TaxID=1220188 RepID=A0A4S3JJ28_9EURO|nr:uncharacterized protein ATNIH1004_010730 [Aspergillus tanneri]KAA8641791.1 hypothetical protein ATNIH1004_010730 [Aspergillus tanneri]THC95539.1 hypothetical protein EYZ11_004964 [Aspergillus tanneri]